LNEQAKNLKSKGRFQKRTQEQGYIWYYHIIFVDNTWIGAKVIILPERKIGKCCIIRVGSVVTKDLPDYTIVGGNPAKIIRFRKNLKE
jgi:maltose O-acetyltransferase